MDVLSGLPPELWRIPFVAEMVPGHRPELGLSQGGNCQRYAYAVLAHHGRYAPALRSDELWFDAAFTERVDEPEPLDLVLYAATNDSFGAHVGVWLGRDEVLHLCEEVGTPVIWNQRDFDERDRYRTRVGFKRLRPAVEHAYEAAGGVVIHDGQVLVLERPSRSEIRLPKGHVEQGETDAPAAVREVGEEAGYPDVEIVDDLGVQPVTFVAYPPGGPAHHIVRREHYFRMRLTTDRTIERPASDHKFVPRWVDMAEATDAMTFDNEREWVRRAIADWLPATE